MGTELLIILTTMSNKKKRFILPEEEIPQYWYNIQADMVNKPMPPLHPGTKQPLKAEDLYPIFAEELYRQELNQTDTWIEIPEEVREMQKILPQHSAGARLWNWRKRSAHRHISTSRTRASARWARTS